MLKSIGYPFLFLIDTRALVSVLLLLFFQIKILAQCPVISPSDTSICSGSSVQLLASGATSYTWYPTAGLSNSTIPNPIASPLVTTLYSVVGNCSGSNDTSTVLITVNPLPNLPTILVNPSTLQCAGTLINFSITNPQGGVNYIWDFGDGTFGSGNTTTHTFSSSGNGTVAFTVSATATFTSTGCSVSKTTTVQVKQSPDPSLMDFTSPTPFTNCSGTSFTLTVDNISTTSSTNTNYSINWGDGSANFNSSIFTTTSHTYLTLGYFNLAFTVTGQNGCVSSNNYQVYNGSNPAGGLGSPGSTIGLCPPYTLTFPITGTTLNAPGTIYILTSNDGTIADTFQHPPPPSYSHTFNNSSCGATGGIIPNSYFEQLTIENPCGFTISTIEPITINSPPIANFTILPDTVVCVNTNVTFTNTSTDGVNVSNLGVCDTTTKFNWVISPSSGWSLVSGDFGDDPPSNNPTSWGSNSLVLNFITPGTYTMELQTASTLNLCGESVKTRTICVNPNPISSFTINPNSGCSPLTITTTNTSLQPICGQNNYNWTVAYSGSSCPPNTSNWQFTNGTNASSVNPTFQFINAGTYTITLTTDNQGCNPVSSSTTVNVKTVPVIVLGSIPNICQGQSITPSATVYNCYASSGPTYSWSFPGGSPSSSSSANPGSILYSSSGNYTITLTVSNECGSTSVTTNFTVLTAPAANAGSDIQICKGGSISLNGSIGGSATSGIWTEFPVGGTYSPSNTTLNATFTPPSAFTGIITLTLTTDATGPCNPATDIVILTVNPLPTPGVNSPTICAGQSATLTATGGGTYLWSTGQTSASITVSPPITTSYTVTVTNTFTCSASTIATVTVNPLPVVNAGPDITLCNQPIPQTLTGYSPIGGTWSGTNVTAGGVFTPNGTGSFILTYTFIDLNTCSNSDNITVTVINPTPVTINPAYSVCVNAPAVNLNTILNPNISGGAWTGTNVSGNNFTPASVGNFQIIYSFGSGTCLTSDTSLITVNPLPTPGVNSPTICDGQSATLTATGGGTYLWSTTATGATITVSPPVTTSYTVTVTNSFTCSASAIATVTVNPLPVVNAGPDITLCNQPIPQTLTGYSPIGGTWSGTNVTSGGVFTPNGTGSFILTYTFIDLNSCANSDNITVTVINPTPVTINPAYSVCVNAPAFNLNTALNPNITGGTWAGTNVSGNNFTPASVGNFQIIYSFGSGTCLTSDTATIIVNPLPTPTVNSPTICAGQSATLTATGGGTYLWSNGFTTPTITVSPAVTTSYTVTVTNTFTCSASTIATVTVNPLSVVNAGPDITLCNQPIPQTLTGYTPIGGTWSGTNVTAGGVFTPNGTGTFILTYTFIDLNTCTNSDNITVTVINPTPVTINPAYEVCVNAPAVNLNTTLNPNIAGGTWAGTNVSGNNFTPASVGSFQIIYSFGSGTCLTSDTATIIVNPLPTPTVNSPTVCAGQSATLTATGGGTYLWSTGQTSASITVSPPITTSYTVTVTNTFTCSASTIATVTVNPLPVVNAGPDITLCNQPIPQTLTGYSPIGGTWSGTNVTAGGVFTPNGTGTFILTYTFIDLNSCANSDNITVTVINPTPVTINPAYSVCVNAPAFNLNTALNPNITGGTWAGTNVSGNNFTPASVGSFQIIYSFGSGTCLTSDTATITVNPLPTPGVNSPTICAGQSATLTATGGGTYLWSTGQTSASITVSPPITTSYTVTVTNTFTCSASTIATVTVNPLPVVNAGPDITLCNQPIPEILSGYSPSGGTWSGTNVTAGGVFTPNGTGTFILTYTFIDLNSCTNSDNITVTVINPTPVTINPVYEVCVNAPAVNLNTTLNPNIAGGTWAGNNVSGNNFTPVSVGNFQIIYSFGSGTCLTSDTATITVNPLPTPGVNSPTICAGQSATLTATGGGTYLWSTGQTSASITVSPPITTSYTVTVTNTFTCSASAIATITVNPLPIPAFSFDSVGCINIPLTFLNLSTGAFSYQWNFDDGGTSIQTNPTHTYTSTGNYQITLITTSFAGCVDSVSDTIIITELAPISFSMSTDSGCGPLAVSFNPQSIGSGISYNWNFGNGITSDLLNPGTITFSSSSNADTTYIITFSASNLCDTLYFIDSVKVIPEPTAYFGMSTNYGCSPVEVSFSNNSFGLPTSFSWDLGDGSTSTMAIPPTHYYYAGANDTTYYIVLTISNQCGSSIWVDSVHVLPNSVSALINGMPMVGCEPLPVTFTNFSIGANNYYWNFDDGNTSNLFNVAHTFSNSGTYNVSMVANDGCGFDTAYTTITVYPKPISVFTIDQDSICSGQSVQFTNQSQNVSSTLWFFGDGDSSFLANPFHIYQVPGEYTVLLVVAAQNTNCFDTSFMIINVIATPIASFLTVPLDGCQPLLINFQNLTSNSLYHNWSFGDGNSSVDFEPSHLYTDPGQFIVTLVEIGDYGCTDTASSLVNVFPKPEASFLVSQDSSCTYPVLVDFINTSTGAQAYNWNLGNGQTSASTHESANYAGPGAYIIELIASNQYGCSDTTTYTFNVYQSPTAFFDFGPFQGCVPLTIQFDNLSLLGTNFYWDFGDGTFSNEQEPVHIYSTAGLFSPSLIVTGVGGCTDTLESQSIVQAFPSPIASFTYETHNLAAPEATVNFQNYSQDADIYSWFFGDGSSTTETNPTHTYSENDSFLVTLISGNAHGCYDTSMQWINVDFKYGLYVPNALTPENGPSATRLFTPKGVGLESYHIWIYDTWGNLLWDSDKISETGSPLESWNGYYHDELLPQDVYVWKIEAVFKNGVVWKGKEYQNGRIKNTGTVTLLR